MHIPTAEWSFLSDLPIRLSGSSGIAWKAAVAVDDYIYIVNLDAFLQYNTVTDTWTQLPTLPFPANNSTLLFHRGSLLVMCGFDMDYMSPHGHMQKYDLKTKTWTIVKDALPIGLRSPSSFVLTDN